jgi:polyhydroxybutyrate depolymerase
MTSHARCRACGAIVLVAVAAIVASACSSSSHASSPASGTRDAHPVRAAAVHRSAGCRATPAPSGTTDERIMSGGKSRSYQLDVPVSYDGRTPYALVFGLHSLTVSYQIVPGMSGFGDMTPQYRFIDVAPSGLVSTAPYWNAAPVAANYDLTFITNLLDHLEATLCIDTTKVFSIGMSNGAQMSSLLACRLPNRIDGIAPIAGVEYNPPCDGRPVPVIAFHGLRDPIVPYQGGGLNSVTIAKQNFYGANLPPGTPTPTGVDESMRRWAQHNGCARKPIEHQISPEVRKRTWQHCTAPTELYIVVNGGHAWPGKPQPAFEASFGHGTTDIDATKLIFGFLFDRRG